MHSGGPTGHELATDDFAKPEPTLSLEVAGVAGRNTRRA